MDRGGVKQVRSNQFVRATCWTIEALTLVGMTEVVLITALA